MSARSRAKKLAWLRERIEPGSRVLLVGVSAEPGVGTNNLIERGIAERTDATAITYEKLRDGVNPMPCPTIWGDARDLPFDDDTFDYVVSNAVIEHLGEDVGAAAAVRESLRVARKAVFHTTPNRRFPIETHTQLPLLHWAPRRWQERVFAVAKRRFPTSDYWLFTARTLRRLHGRVRVHHVTPMTLVGEWRCAENR